MSAIPQNPANVPCHVQDVTLMGEDVYRVKLAPQDGDFPAFAAGQYLSLAVPGIEPSWFSIASGPNPRQIVLHIQVATHGDTAWEIVQYLRRERVAELTLPFGEACFPEVPERPVLLIVAGTGFAQAKSVVEFLFAQHATQPVFLYWGVRRHEDMYLRSLAEEWARDWRDFHFRPVVSDDEDNDWNGHHEHLVRAVKADGHNLAKVDVLSSGSPMMVYSVMDTLVDAGLPVSQFRSDVLQYAPRD